VIYWGNRKPIYQQKAGFPHLNLEHLSYISAASVGRVTFDFHSLCFSTEIVWTGAFDPSFPLGLEIDED
jgi:hypothetical protein